MLGRAVRARRRSLVSLFGEGAAMQVVRTGFGMGERVAPRLMAPLGQRLWFHVSPAPGYPKRDRGFGSGETLEVLWNGRHIATHAWGSGPTVLLVHGWSGWWQQLGLYIKPLVEAGFKVVAFDVPSHGDSAPGRFGKGYSGMPDFADAVEAVARQVAGGAVHGIVSHSAGSMGVAIALSRGITAERIVMVSPSVDGDDQIDFVARRLGWGPRTRDEVKAYVQRRYGIDLQNYTLDRFNATGLALPPALFVHDADDHSTPSDGSERLAAVWPGSRVVETSGLGHFRILWTPAVIRQVVGFVAGGDDAQGRPEA